MLAEERDQPVLVVCIDQRAHCRWAATGSVGRALDGVEDMQAVELQTQNESSMHHAALRPPTLASAELASLLPASPSRPKRPS